MRRPAWALPARVRIDTGLILAYSPDTEGLPSATVISANGAVTTDVRVLGLGGGGNNALHIPVEPSPQGGPELMEHSRVGAHALLIYTEDGTPYVLAGIPSPVQRDARFAPGTERGADLDVAASADYPQRVSHRDCLVHQSGSQIVVGASAGVTLDTRTSGAPVRVQVPSTGSLRVSQTGSPATDRVMLASPLYAKLQALETTVAALVAKIEEMAAVLTLVTSPGNGAPLVSPAAFAMTPALIPSWGVGPASSLQASCVSISPKTVGDT